MYSFQSKDRSADLGHKVHFHLYSFSTEDEKIAAFIRRNCKANPSMYWETPSASTPKEEAKVEVPKKNLGRPIKAKTLPAQGVRVNIGMRTSEVTERVQE